ncbi:hypothetical protein H6800_00025 [Candidatus Nomurabacteria bacterium]|nr:hypothetical protein [Candidatus Nomurabacteria bacterium]
MSDFLAYLILVLVVSSVFIYFEYRRRIFLKTQIKKGNINILDPVFVASSRNSTTNQIGNSLIVLGEKSLKFFERGKFVVELKYSDVAEVRCTQALWTNEYKFIKKDGSTLDISTGAKVDTASATKRVGIALLLPFIGRRSSVGMGMAGVSASAGLQIEAAHQLNDEMRQRGLNLVIDATATERATKKWNRTIFWSLFIGFFGTFLVLAILSAAVLTYQFFRDASKRATAEREKQALIQDRKDEERDRKLASITFQTFDTDSPSIEKKGNNQLSANYDSKSKQYVDGVIDMERMVDFDGDKLKIRILQSASSLSGDGDYFCSRQDISDTDIKDAEPCQTSTSKGGTKVYSFKDSGVSTGKIFLIKDGTLISIKLQAFTEDEESRQLNMVVDSLRQVDVNSLNLLVL